MMTATFLAILIAFTVLAIWLCFKNDFSSEMESVLYKAIGAIAVAGYFAINSFVVSPAKELSFEVPVPLMYEPRSGSIFSANRISAHSLPEEMNMFRGLGKYNLVWRSDCLKTIEFGKKLQLPEDKNSETSAFYRMQYLEFVFFQWLQTEVNWLKISEVTNYTQSGYGGGGNYLEPSPKVATEASLNEIENPNPLFVACPMKLSLPKGSAIDRKTENGQVMVTISTDAGILNINFVESLRGNFDENMPTSLVQNLAAIAREKVGGPLPPTLEVSYPKIQLKYSAARASQFSDQAKSEIVWIKKLDKYLFRDFSWDLLREDLSFDFKAALDLYRKHSEKVDQLKI